MAAHNVTRDEWTYEGHDIAYNPDGKNKLYIDEVVVDPDELGSMIYSRERVREYIEEEFDVGPGTGTLDEYPWRDD